MNLENLHCIYFMYTCSKLLVYYVMTQSFLLDTTVFSFFLFRWRHWEINSERLFNISLGLPTISNFSCKHNCIFFNWGCMIYSWLLYSRISVGEIFLKNSFADSFIQFRFLCFVLTQFILA